LQAIVDDVLAPRRWIVTVGLVGKKTASVYTCGRMVCDHEGGAGTERRGICEVGEPCSAFVVGRFNDASIIVRELKKLVSLPVSCLEVHVPLVY